MGTKRWSKKDVERYLERQYEMTGRKIRMPVGVFDGDAEFVLPEPVGATDLKEEEEQ
jgi:hypothetical protein